VMFIAAARDVFGGCLTRQHPFHLATPCGVEHLEAGRGFLSPTQWELVASPNTAVVNSMAHGST